MVRAFPLGLAGGAGCRVTDVDGHEYVDFINEYTAGVFGHSEPVIGAAMRPRSDDGITLGGPNSTSCNLPMR